MVLPVSKVKKRAVGISPAALIYLCEYSIDPPIAAQPSAPDSSNVSTDTARILGLGIKESLDLMNSVSKVVSKLKLQ